MEKNAQHLYIKIVTVGVVVGVLSFGAGMKYQQKQTPTFGSGRFGMMGQGGNTVAFGQGRTGGQRGMMGLRPVAGEIISSDDKSITVKLNDGSSKIVFLSEKTVINKASVASKSDLANGQRVAIFGETNADGSVTAQNIQLNPQERQMMGTGASPSATPSSNTRY
jgi:hypothetical protein